MENAAKHLLKLCVQNPVSEKWVYPFAQHELVGGWLQSMLGRHRTIYEANYCIKQHDELWYTTVAELAHLAWNGGASSLVQNIDNFTANIVRRNPYWFQRRKKLTAQAEQERLKGTLFLPFWLLVIIGST